MFKKQSACTRGRWVAGISNINQEYTSKNTIAAPNSIHIIQGSKSYNSVLFNQKSRP